MIAGHSLSWTFSPGRTRKSFESIFIFTPSVWRELSVCRVPAPRDAASTSARGANYFIFPISSSTSFAPLA